MIELIFSN